MFFLFQNLNHKTKKTMTSPAVSMLDQLLQMASGSCSACGLDLGDMKKSTGASAQSSSSGPTMQGGIDDIKQALLLKFRETLKAKIIDGFPC